MADKRFHVALEDDNQDEELYVHVAEGNRHIEVTFVSSSGTGKTTLCLTAKEACELATHLRKASKQTEDEDK